MIKESLQKILKDKDQIVDDPEILKEFSEDHSFVPSKIPVLVVKPKTRPEVQQVIQLANEEEFHLIPVSSGNPRLHGDTVPVKDNTVILDLRKLNKIHWVERKNRVCVIEPGVTFTQLEKEVEKKGLRLLMPLCPKASKSVIVASLEREPKTLTKYEWDVCDPLASTEIMLGNGEILWAGEVGMCGNDEKWQREHGFSHKVPFGVATVNIKKMAGGAQGTIGICTWSSVRLELLPEFEDIYMVGSENVAELADFAHQLVYDRTADDIFILNSLNLASMVKKEPADIISLSKTLPPWVLIYTVSGFGTLPKNMFEYKKNLIEERNIPMTDSVSGLTSKDIIHLIRKPSDEPYWKLRLKGDTRDLFFQTSLKKTASFIKSMKKLTAEAGFPESDLGIYIQPQKQGVCCHLEFDFNISPNNKDEADRVKKLIKNASKQLLSEGAFFSRPFSDISDMVFSNYPGTVSLLKKIKNIFDPKRVLSPGRLVFTEVFDK